MEEEEGDEDEIEMTSTTKIKPPGADDQLALILEEMTKSQSRPHRRPSPRPHLRPLRALLLSWADVHSEDAFADLMNNKAKKLGLYE